MLEETGMGMLIMGVYTDLKQAAEQQTWDQFEFASLKPTLTHLLKIPVMPPDIFFRSF